MHLEKHVLITGGAAFWDRIYASACFATEQLSCVSTISLLACVEI
jgi:hypothetical protein